MDTQAKGGQKRKIYISVTAVFKSGESQPNHDHEGKQTVLASTLAPKCDEKEKWYKKQIWKESSVVPPVLSYHGLNKTAKPAFLLPDGCDTSVCGMLGNKQHT